MANSLGIISIPASYKVLRDAVGIDKIGQVLLECPDDLLEFKKNIAEVSTSQQGKLAFLKGEPGQGKTSFVESTDVFLSDAIASVITAPPEYELPLGQLMTWLAPQLVKERRSSNGRLIVINLDGREIPVLDEASTQAAMGNLNAFLRNNRDLLLIWPVNQQGFAEQAIERLQIAGGESALVSSPIHLFKGLPKERFFDALRLLLDATNTRLEDAAISEQEARDLVSPTQRIGEYLRQIQQLVVSRYDLGEIGAALPRLKVVFTANDDANNSCRLLRRGTKFMADADKLLQYSRANIVDDWKRRGADNPRSGLPFICALFEVQILSLSSSAVVNACACGSDEELRTLVRAHYSNPHRINAANTMRNSSLAKALRGEEDGGVAQSNTSQPIQDAFTEIQKLTNRKHKQINESIVDVLRSQLTISMPELSFEHEPFRGSDRELRSDVWFVPDGGRPTGLEFTHRRNGDASAAVLSSYMLSKIQDYARDYGLL
jgi:hypothetical protein